MQSVVRVGVGQIPEALHALQKNGFVIVEQAISSQPLSILRNRMDADTVELLDFCESRGGNPRQKGHLQQRSTGFSGICIQRSCHESTYQRALRRTI